MRVLLQVQESGPARASRPLVLEHAGLEEAPPRAPGPEASLPPMDARQVQQRELQLEERAGVLPLSRRLLSRRDRLQRRFRRPLHPSGAA